MRSAAFLLFFATSSLAACAATPSADDDLAGNADEVSGRDGGKTSVNRDAGSSSGSRDASSSSSGSSGSSSNRDAGKSTADASTGLPDINDIINGITGGGKDAGTTKPKNDGGLVDSCQNQICFDVFDCAIFHTDKLDCGFTACDGFICK